MIVFDLTDLYSLSSCPKWLEDALKANVVRPLVFLVGSKRDLLVCTVCDACFSVAVLDDIVIYTSRTLRIKTSRVRRLEWREHCRPSTGACLPKRDATSTLSSCASPRSPSTRPSLASARSTTTKANTSAPGSLVSSLAHF